MKKSARVEGGRQHGMRLLWSDEEHDWLTKRAKGKGIAVARLLRTAVARDALRDGDSPPETLCTADDYSEGVCAR